MRRAGRVEKDKKEVGFMCERCGIPAMRVLGGIGGREEEQQMSGATIRGDVDKCQGWGRGGGGVGWRVVGERQITQHK
jgi:hypothetical protein